MAIEAKTYVTPDEYLALERQSREKHEYVNGAIVAMGGVLIVTNLVRELSTLLHDRACFVYSTDLRVWIEEANRFTYPDVVVVCGEPIFHDEHGDSLVNPMLIVEVLSESTKDYDRGEKFAQYRTLDALKEYVLVAQDQVHVEQYVRQAPGRWLLSETNDLGDVVELEAIAVQLALADVYHKVEGIKG